MFEQLGGVLSAGPVAQSCRGRYSDAARRTPPSCSNIVK